MAEVVSPAMEYIRAERERWIDERCTICPRTGGRLWGGHAIPFDNLVGMPDESSVSDVIDGVVGEIRSYRHQKLHMDALWHDAAADFMEAALAELQSWPK